ncbi:aspartate 1-decarboxylase [Mucilaginibacter sp. Bleaf8]|uniref:aspartate 1-decarboxylase n=1 Tax=Mucilaginibacter sp. Bleaf8 TaxID=2834430 RepID=UPI001BCC31D1|nr:aspartate 1-decarboxylase [Mucilaginibacter sp. Bleaf8]MBS7565475.1 aspartate 1-decarboxylase [Mucilaginibacter sp. Bleaf8]
MTLVLKSEIQHILVKRVYPDGEDYLLLDEAILKAAKIQENEKVLICNHANGARFETYVLKAGKNSQACFICGPAARLVHFGDPISITTYARWLTGQIPAGYPVILAKCKESAKKQH